MKHAIFVFLFVIVHGVTGRVATSIRERLLNGSDAIFNNGDTIVFDDEVTVEEPSEISEEPSVKPYILDIELTDRSQEGDTTRKISYTGNQLWKTVVNNVNQLKLLAELIQSGDISTWGGNTTYIDILVKPGSINKTKYSLENENMAYRIVIEDLQKAIDEENPPVEITDDRQGHRLTWQSYHRIQDIYGYLDYLAQTYPDLCTVRTIGQSVENRALKLIKISNGNPSNKAIWIDGGIHAREWITSATATYIINHLVLNFENEPDYVQNLDWYIAPLMNPDGYEHTHNVDRLWRKNRAKPSGFCYGTDLNRNFGYRWGGQGSSKNPCTETYGGSGPFSEPETAAIQRFITGTRANWKAYISLHSYGQYILYPWGYGRVVPPDHQDLAAVGRKAAQAIQSVGGPSYTVGPAGSTLYPASGGSDDWAKGTVRMKYAYTLELRDNGRYGFVLPAHYINPTAKETLAAVRVIAEAASKA